MKVNDGILFLGMMVAVSSCGADFSSKGELGPTNKFVGDNPNATKNGSFNNGPDSPYISDDQRMNYPPGNNGNPDSQNPSDLPGKNQTDVCKYLDPNLKTELPHPVFVHKKITGGRILAMNAIPGYGALAPRIGPKINVAEYVKGKENQQEVRFTTTVYLPVDPVKTALGQAEWTLVPPPLKLVEADYNVKLIDPGSPDCQLLVDPVPSTRGDVVGDIAGCFMKGTTIKMANGKDLPIEVVSKGDKVFNPITGKAMTVVETTKGPEKGKLYIVSSNGHSVTVTKDHPFLTPHGVVAAENLASGDSILGKNGERQKIKVNTVEMKHSPVVYNLVVSKESLLSVDHAILANGIVSGDLFLQRQLIQLGPVRAPAPLEVAFSVGF